MLDPYMLPFVYQSTIKKIATYMASFVVVVVVVVHMYPHILLKRPLLPP
jgi:hypothetical protein